MTQFDARRHPVTPRERMLVEVQIVNATHARRGCWGVLIGLLATAAAAGPSGASKNVQVELLSEVTWVQPGAPFFLGVRQRMAPGWHTYWTNPGDSGLPTRMRWELPEGFTAEPFLWPTPQAISAPPLVSYGYEREVLLLARVTPPATLAPGGDVTLGGRLDWLECEKACLPGKAQLDLVLPVRAEAPAPDPEIAALFAAARARLPEDGAAWSPRAHADPQRVALSFRSPRALRAASFFPETRQAIEYARPQRLLRTSEGYRLEMTPAVNGTTPEQLAGVLVVEEEGGSGALALRVSAGVDAPGSAVALAPGIEIGAPRPESGGRPSLPLALALAFVGGLILNLMPCVLPVLSLKIMGFVRHAGERGAAFRHGLAYTLGVLVSFWALAGLLLLLRAGGEQVGWGFQLQSPPFVVFLACLFFVIGLNLFGVFEVGLSLTAAGGTLRQGSGLPASFFGGALATLVATPCTAPFMGSALGFALTQPAVVSLLIFTALGLGMAAPYLLLSLQPRLLRFVPRPGRWMESFKQLMGFFMMGTVVVLVWVFGRQAGIDAVTALLAGLVILGLGAWTYGRGTAPEARAATRRVAYVLSAALAAAGLLVGFTQAKPAPPQAAGAPVVQGGITWEPWSPERVRSARAEGRTLLIDFTAAWCLTCQVNERVAFGSAEVQQRLSRDRVLALRADWTNRDDAITRALQSYGRSGVPLYVLYGPGRSEAHLLPEVINPGLVLAGLDAVGSGR